MTRVLAAASTFVALLAFADASPQPERPQRIVSLNLCTDQILLQLVPHERIAALSFLSQDTRSSALSPLARGMHTVRGNAEEVLALQPDLVLVGTYTTRHTNAMLRRFGIPVVAIPGANSFEEVRAEMRAVAKAVGEQARGEELIRQFDARLDQLRASALPNDEVIMQYRSGGYTAGSNTLYDSIYEAAGLINGAKRAGVKGYGVLPMERLIEQRPGIINASDYKPDTPTQGNRMLTHPAIAALGAQSIVLASRDTVCGGIWNLDAAALVRTQSQAP
ncbi:ABC transporter substrate-binding protein (plasmid) [Diaphorobacter sp. HDW4B]|uniref:ABC transporter substrate-binding protein n=1 Tax=Diaphorobacter sp. HDW4B TaxID=2714925 RepID=UPI00140E58AB|nr:ABC transporter substrate-binding protein [Diaphorobacter sp. HDW4B]QIL73817.1 ABC transporter substrate-binding protein [Diaphorobacter sp. HDW4B]